jgi:spermidine synthase
MIGSKVLERRNSPLNGEITVVKSIAFGIYIQVANLTQSGGVISEIWESTVKKIRKSKKEAKNVLILGLGGGSAAYQIRYYFPEARIVGVDIDPIMVELGKKYLGLKDIEVGIEDAVGFVERTKEKYDLILVDTYLGDEFPKKLENDKFLNKAKELLKKDGIIVFNRLYYDEKRPQAVKFGEKLETVFGKVEAYYPEANVMYICSD